MSNWTAASSDCGRPLNDDVHIKTADLYRPNARFTPERQRCQVLTPFGKLGYSHFVKPPRSVTIHYHPGKTYGAKLLKGLLEDIGCSTADMKRLKLIKKK